MKGDYSAWSKCFKVFEMISNHSLVLTDCSTLGTTGIEPHLSSGECEWLIPSLPLTARFLTPSLLLPRCVLPRCVHVQYVYYWAIHLHCNCHLVFVSPAKPELLVVKLILYVQIVAQSRPSKNISLLNQIIFNC